MATVTIRPFSATVRRPCGGPLLPGHSTRILIKPLASAKGFGDPKKDTVIKSTQQQRQGSSDALNATPPPPPVAAPRSRMVQETPQVVVDRMFRRILIFTGVPVFTGMALFPLFYWLRVVQDIEYPLWIVYIAQVFTFGGGLAGITYGALSASWDPSREGSALGWTEMQANLSIVMNNRNKNME